MMLKPLCERCGMPATMTTEEPAPRYFCTQHAFDEVVEAKGAVPKLKGVR